MTDDADRDWIDALAGRTPEGADDAAVREAAALRAGILAREDTEPATVPERDAWREDLLIARARREGLIPSRPAGSAGWRRGWHATAVIAAAASVVVAIGFLTREAPEPERVRSAPGAVVRLESPQPQALQRRIVEELRAAGVEATAYERLGAFGIDADLPEPLPSEIEDVLRRHGIPAPRGGVLAVEIAPRPEP